MPFKPVPRPWRLRSSRKRQYSECGSPSRLPERQHRAMTEAAAGMVRAGMVRGCRARRRCRDAIDRRAAFADNRRQFQGSCQVPVVALDFETANEERGSACAVGLAWIDGLRVVRVEERLIRPEPFRFSPFNTQVHGIAADKADVNAAVLFMHGQDRPSGLAGTDLGGAARGRAASGLRLRSPSGRRRCRCLRPGGHRRRRAPGRGRGGGNSRPDRAQGRGSVRDRLAPMLVPARPPESAASDLSTRFPRCDNDWQTLRAVLTESCQRRQLSSGVAKWSCR